MDQLQDFAQRVPQPVYLGFAFVGAAFLGSKLWTYLQLVLSAFVLSGTSLRKYGKPGSWVVITGASDGLGKEFAIQLASKGYNLVLVSRTLSKLEALATEIDQKYADKKIQIKTLAMDFSKDNNADYERLRGLNSGLDVAVLINNVGQSHTMPVSFLETSNEELQNIITINCLGTLKVTKVVAPIMKERKKGLILTMGSTAGWAPVPLLATYGGSKAFLQHWNAALSAELSEFNIDTYLVLSHLVTTAMSKVRRPSLLIPNTRNFVKSALGKIGLGTFQNAYSAYTPWWPHAYLVWAAETFLGVNSPILIWYNKVTHVDIRKRALRKKERDAKKQ
jgi:17beta-estradiol 17-dehydrogenase / very-long-chain 3-oxoacyl-CoA reductase